MPAASVTLIVGALMVARDAGLLAFAWAVLSTAAGQASVGWSNDYLDRRRDAAAGRLEKPIVAGTLSPHLVLAGAVTAFACCVALAIPLGGTATAVMAVGVSSAWSYNAVLKDTVLSWAPYALSFGLLPVFVWLATPRGGAPRLWIVVGASSLGIAGHLMNVLPDLESDARFRHRGLPHRLGLRGSLALACLILAAILVVVLIGVRIWDDPTMGQIASASVAAALILAVAWSGLHGRHHLAFYLTITAVASMVIVLLVSPGTLRA